MDNNIEFYKPRLSNSKSCDDFSTFFENVDEINYIKSLTRKGAIRNKLPYDKKISFINQSKNTIKDVIFPYENEQQNDIKEPDKRQRKFSVGSFITVKDMWKTFKKENKDSKVSSTTLSGCSCKVYDLEVKTFLDSCLSTLHHSTELPFTALETPLDGFIEDNKDLQAAVWEIIDTEANFLKQLGIVTQIFYPLLEKLLIKYHVEVRGIDVENVFGNIKDIYSDHLNLWNTYISLPLSKKQYLDISLMKEGFCKISTFLSSYNHFMDILPAVRKTIRKLQNENHIIYKYIEWTMKHNRACHDGCLWILHAPFQRIMKYKILLERVKSLSNEDQEEDINSMIISIHNFLQQINTAFVGQYSMKEIKDKIIEINVGRSIFFDMDKFVNEDSTAFDITKSLDGFQERILIHEGRLKLKECSNKTMDIQCYLCNDLFMICKPFKMNWDKLKIFKGPIRLDKVACKEESEDCLVIKVYNDFKVIEGIFPLVGETVEIKLWIEKFSKTISSFINQFRDPVLPLNLQNEYVLTCALSKEDGYLSDENPDLVMRSETSSFSRMSIDSTYSQTSGNSTKANNNNRTRIKSILKPSQDDKYHSAENFFYEPLYNEKLV